MEQGQRLVGLVGDAPADFAVDDETVVKRYEGTADSVLAADTDLVVAVGEAALFAVARLTPDVPVLPVDAGRNFGSVSLDSLVEAVEHALEHPGDVRSCPILGVRHDGDDVARAVADVTLLTAEVAHISEYEVAAAGDRVSRFRADGVVVATPAGSSGYARRVGCPTVAPGSGVGPVAPVAPFAIDPDHWILPLDDLRLTVERDETTVTLLADDREVATVAEGEPVRVTRAGTVRIATGPATASHFP